MLVPASSAFAALVALVAAALIGIGIRRVLPEKHKAKETVQLVQLAIGMMVTFAALMLSLLTASAKTGFDNVIDDFHVLSSDLIQLDGTLQTYEGDANKARVFLRSYVAARIASTWPHELPPPGTYYPKDIAPKDESENLDDARLDQLLGAAGKEICRLEATDSYHQALRSAALEQFARVMGAHWKLIEQTHSSISQPFFLTMVFWLFLIFLSFGLIAPHNTLAVVTIGLGAVSLASVVHVIVDFDTFFRGLIVVPSQPMRDALSHMTMGMH